MRFLSLFVLAAVLTPGSVLYSVQAVGLAGVTGGIGLNNAGTVVGYSTDQRLQKHAWVHGSGSAGATEIASGAITGGVNDAGAVAGTSWRQGAVEATTWTTVSTPVLRNAYALDINNSGSITGGGVHGNRGSAFIQGADQTTWLDLGWWSSAYDINDRGDVAGYYLTGSTARAFKWTSGTGATTLTVPGGGSTYAHALNEDGIVAGTANFGSGSLTAAVWSGVTSLNLGTLGGSQSGAYGINRSGAVVGYALDNWSRRRAFVWTGSQMQDLNSLVDASTGWILEEAFAINDAGQIAGTGKWNGANYAFLLTPSVSGPQTHLGVAPAEVPEPATFLSVAVALLSLGQYGRRFQRRC